MVILGLNFYFHDSSACIVSDGKLIVGLEEERFSREKHSRKFPKLAIRQCCEIAGINPSDIDHIAISIKPFHNALRKIIFTLRNLSNAKVIYDHELKHALKRMSEFRGWFNNAYKEQSKKPTIHYLQHHLSHVAGSFLVSPYDDAALFGVDGAGEWATTWIGHGHGLDVTCFNQSFFPDSLGSFYESITQYCGFRTNYDEGKIMSLASYGDAGRFYDDVSTLIHVTDSGDISLDLDYFNFQHFSWDRLSPKFEQKFGPRRKLGEELEAHHIDLAAAFQKVLEKTALRIVHNLHEKTRARHLVLSGGVTLNSVMNGKIVSESPFEDVYVMPAPGDNGTSIGAAYYLWNNLLRKPRTQIHDDPFIGTEYTNGYIEKVLNLAKIDYTFTTNVARETAELLAKGSIVGWFQGRMEFGPRSLGGRSILADPTLAFMKDKINAEVKFREPFRPFAPASTKEAFKKYFDSSVECPFMLKICNVRQEFKEMLPAVTHVDGTARLQTVRREHAPVFHALIEEFGKIRGMPVVLNTSFNIQGEPIVESPLDAIKCFSTTGLDALVIGNCIVIKGKQFVH